MTSVKVKFSPSSVILKEGTVHYQIIHHCKVRHIRTGYKLFPSEWISASGEINVSAGSGEGRKSYLAALKNQIDKDLFRIKKCINRLNQEDTPFTVDRIIELYTAPEGNCTFLLYGKELLVELRQIGKVRTAGTYQNALNSFERFRGHRGDIPLDEMDSNQMITYESWLKGTGVCPNTSSYYMRNLRAIYNRAVSEGLVVQRNPFKHVYTGIDKTKKRAVSLSVIREKPMQELIDKYNTSETSYLLPIIQNNGVDEWHQYQNEAHRINRNLKHIGKQIGLGIPLTTYVARHAWASIAQSKNVSLPVISEALGHDSEQTTRIYLASLDASIVDTANSLILMSI